MHGIACTSIRESISSVYDTLTITVWVRGTIDNVGRAVLANDTDIGWESIDPMFIFWINPFVLDLVCME